GEASAERVDEELDRGRRVRIDVAARCDLRDGEARAAALLVLALDRGPARERLEAPPLAAVADGATVGPHGVVPPLAGDPVRAVPRLSAHDEAAAHAGAEDDAEDDPVPIFARRPEPCLREREAVRVVVETEGTPELPFEVLAKRAAVQARGVR